MAAGAGESSTESASTCTQAPSVRARHLCLREVGSAPARAVMLAESSGEQPLPSYGCCDLGSVDLTRFVHDPFTPGARFDFSTFAATVGVGIAGQVQQYFGKKMSAGGAAPRRLTRRG